MWHGELFGLCRALVIRAIFRLAILALLAGFSEFSFAGFFYTNGYTSDRQGGPDACFSTQQAACLAVQIPAGPYGPQYDLHTEWIGGQCRRIRGDGEDAGTLNTAYNCSETCPAGQQRFSGNCAAPVQCNGGTVTPQNTCTCPSGSTLTNGTCLTNCPEGQSRAYGDPVLSMRYPGNPSGPSGCNTQAGACASQAGAKAPSNSLQSQMLGCNTSCQVSTSGDYKYLCTYTGGAATGTCTTINADGSACGTDPNGTANTPLTNVNPAPSGGCPSGTTSGTVNGKQYCAGSGNTNVAQSGSQTGQNANGTNTEVASTTTQTTTNANGTTTTTVITTTSGALGSSANPTFAKLDPNAPNAVSIKGAGSCDPTKSDYAQCIGMSGQGQCVDNPATPENECTGSGDGEGDGDCDPTAADYIECIAPQGGMPDHTAGNAQTFGEAADNFMTGLQQTGPVQIIDGLSHAFDGASSGECPAPSFDAFGEAFTIDMHCTLFDQFGSMLTNVFGLLWCLFGIRIIASA